MIKVLWARPRKAVRLYVAIFLQKGGQKGFSLQFFAQVKLKNKINFLFKVKAALVIVAKILSHPFQMRKIAAESTTALPLCADTPKTLRKEINES